MSILHPAQPPPSAPVCLPAIKFSYSTIPIGSVGPLPWTHIACKGKLFLLFETVRVRTLAGTTEERKKFKILQDPDVMEDLDLEVLSREAHRSLEQCKDGVDHARQQQCCIIVKKPVIAGKYPIEGGQIRRFQVRLEKDEDYYEAMKIFSRANVPTVEAGTFPTSARPQSAVSNTPSTMVAARPQSANSNAPTLVNQSPSRHYHLQTGNTPQESASARALMPPPPYFPAPTRQEQAGFGPFQNLANDLTSPAYHSPAHKFPRLQDDHSPTPVNHADTPSSTVAPCSAEYAGATTAKQTLSTYTPRPSCAPTAPSQQLSQVLPPKRQLPFEREKLKLALTPEILPSRMTRSMCRASEMVREDAIASEVCVPDSQDSAAGASNKRKRKPTAKAKDQVSSSKEPAKKKLRATTSGKKAKTKGAKNDTPVPSIEELLKDITATKPEVTKGNQFDTQALFDRAENMRTARKATTEADRGPVLHATSMIPSKSCGNAIWRPDSAANRANDVAETTARFCQLPVKLSESTPADQVLHPSTPSAPQVPRIMSINPPPASSLADGAFLATQPQDITSVPRINDNALSDVSKLAPQVVFPALNNTYDFPNYDQAVELLLTHPLFISNLHGWSELPSQTQRATLETWICEQYQDKSFAVLCKMLEGIACGSWLLGSVDNMWHRGVVSAAPIGTAVEESGKSHLQALKDD